MPIVFVHGVNNRLDDDYRDNQSGRNGFLREIVAPALGLPPDRLTLINPYWGSFGARFAWNMAVLPDSRESGPLPARDAGPHRQTVELLAASGFHGGIVDNARRDLPATVDMLYASALAATDDEAHARTLAASYQRVARYAETRASPSWLERVEDSRFIEALHGEALAGEQPAFGIGALIDSLEEGLERILTALPHAAAEVATRLARRRLNANATRFVGDALVYFDKRGTPQAPGPIAETVRKALEAGAAARTAEDPRLTVIAHSFGGAIVYDLLTGFARSLQVDCLITVGAQVGLFEEMKLYRASRDDLPPDPPRGRVARPANLGRWLNVYDRNDVFGFLAEPVFDGATDCCYDTGYDSLQAHGGYFLRPSFYRRLAAWLAG